jgi:recombination protein RecA
VVKNKVAPPFKSAEFDIMYGRGISREGSVVDVGTELGVLEKSGSWYSYKGERIGQGRENAKMFLAQNTKVMDEIEEKVKEMLNLDSSKTKRKDTEKKIKKEEIEKEKI